MFLCKFVFDVILFLFQTRDSEEVIEDGQVVDMSSNNSMTSQDIYIEDQALDLSIAGAMAKHSASQSDVALDLSISNPNKPKSSQKSAVSKSVTKRRRSSAMDVDYTVKFGNYGLAGAPRTKRQLSLLLKKKEEEEEKQRKQAEAQHSMEDIAHAEILISLKSASNEENESESIELDDKDIKEAVSEQAQDVDMEEDEQSEKVTDENIAEVETEQEMIEKLDDGKSDTHVQDVDKDHGTDTKDKNSKTVEKQTIKAIVKAKSSSYKCGICMEIFENLLGLNEHLNNSENQCVAKLMSLRDVSESQLGLTLPQVKSDKICIKSEAELNEHQKTHTNLHSCDIDEKMFLTVNELSSNLVSHDQSEMISKNGVADEQVNEKGAADISKVVDGNDSSPVSKITDQKNLYGEPVDCPAAGSVTIPGMSLFNTPEDEVANEKGETVVSIHKIQDSRKSTGVRKEKAGNDVVDGEHRVESDDELHRPEQFVIEGNIPKTLRFLSPKLGTDSAPASMNILKSDDIKKDMVLCGLCNLRLDFKDVQSHLESHKNAQDRKSLEIKEECPCMICDKMIPIKMFYTHLRSHSVYDLSVALSNQMNVDKCMVKKGKFVCNLCPSTFSTTTELMNHVKSHLGPRNEGESKKTSSQKRKVAGTDRKSKKIKTKDNSQSAKRKQTSNTITTLEKLKQHLADNDTSELYDITVTPNVLCESKSDSTPVLTAALNRKPKCETSIMALISARKKKLPHSVELLAQEGSKTIEKEEVVKNIENEIVNSGISLKETDNELETISQVDEAKKSEDDNFLAASRRLQEFVNLKEHEQSVKVPEASMNESESTGTSESEDFSISQVKKNLQQKILLVRHGDIKVATPFFGPVSSVSVESSQQNTVEMYGPVAAQTKRNSNVPVLSSATVTDTKGRNKKVIPRSPAIVSGSSVTADLSNAVPVTLVRNYFSMPITGQNTSLKQVSAVTLKKSSAPTTQASKTFTPLVTSASQVTAVDPSAILPLSVSLKKASDSQTSVSYTSVAQSSAQGLSLDVSSILPTSISLTSVSKSALTSTVAHVMPLQRQLSAPGVGNVNILMAKGQTSANKSVVVSGLATNTGVKSPVFKLAFVSVADKSQAPLNSAITSGQENQTKLSTVSQRNIFACSICRQPLSSIDQMTSHSCNTVGISSAGQQLVSLTLLAKSSASESVNVSDSNSSGITSTNTTTHHAKLISTPTVLKPALSTLKIPLVGGLPATKCAVTGSSVTVQSSPVTVGMDKAKFVLSRSAILAKSSALTTQSTQTGSMMSSSALSMTDSSTIGSNLLRVSPGILSSAGIKDSNQALALYPCAICRQIYMNQESFVKHMQEHVNTKVDDKGKTNCIEDSKTITPDPNAGNTVFKQKIKSDNEKTESVSVDMPAVKFNESAFTSNGHNSMTADENKNSGLGHDLIKQKSNLPADSSGKATKIMECGRCFAMFENERALVDHYEGVHPSMSGFRCYSDTCPKTFCKERDVDFHYAMEHVHKCLACVQRTSSYDEFDKHVKKHAKAASVSKLICTKCNIIFRTKFDMAAHLTASPTCRDGMGNESNAFIQCDCYDTVFSSYDLFLEHFQNNHYLKLVYRCCVCLTEFALVKPDSLQDMEKKVLEHMKGHHTNAKFCFCHVCYFLFPNREVQSVHMASASHKKQISFKVGGKQLKPKPDVAKKPGSVIKKRKNLKQPPSSRLKRFRGRTCSDDEHLSELSQTCIPCNVCFSSLFQLKAHKAIWHNSTKKRQHATASRNLSPSGRQERLLACTLCGKSFFSLNLLQRHRKNHESNTLEMVCTEPRCMRIFTSRAAMKSHSCPANDSSFEESSRLATRHYKNLTQVSTNELEQYILRHDAKNCELQLEKSSWIIEQIQVDLGNYFKCSFCDNFYDMCETLRQHLVKNHSAELYQCVDCEQYFDQNSSLMTHRKECAVRAFSDLDFHTKKRVLGCDVCYKAFIELVSLACYVTDRHIANLDKTGIKTDLKASLERLKVELEIKNKCINLSSSGSDSVTSSPSGVIVCMECKNEYCNADDLYICMKSRLDPHIKRVFGDITYRNPSETILTCSNDSLFYCNKCETIVCYQTGDLCLAVMQHPCTHSETLI